MWCRWPVTGRPTWRWWRPGPVPAHNAPRRRPDVAGRGLTGAGRIARPDRPARGADRASRPRALFRQVRGQAEGREQLVGAQEEVQARYPVAGDLDHLQRPRRMTAVRVRLVLPERRGAVGRLCDE